MMFRRSELPVEELGVTTPNTPVNIKDLNSILINSHFGSKGQEEAFVSKYYRSNFRYIDENEFKELSNHISDDLTDRTHKVHRVRNMGRRLAVLFGTAISIVAFMRSIMNNKSSHQAIFTYIGYTTVLLGLVFAMVEQFIDESAKTHEEAVSHLKSLLSWVHSQYEIKQLRDQILAHSGHAPALILANHSALINVVEQFLEKHAKTSEEKASYLKELLSWVNLESGVRQSLPSIAKSRVSVACTPRFHRVMKTDPPPVSESSEQTSVHRV